MKSGREKLSPYGQNIRSLIWPVLVRVALVGQHDLPVLLGRLQHREHHFERRHTPAAIVAYGTSGGQSLIHFVQLGHALVVEPLHGYFPLAIVIVYPQAIGRLAYIASRATHHHDTQITLKATCHIRLSRWLDKTRLTAAAEAHCVLETGLVLSTGFSRPNGPPQRLAVRTRWVNGVGSYTLAPRACANSACTSGVMRLYFAAGPAGRRVLARSVAILMQAASAGSRKTFNRSNPMRSCGRIERSCGRSCYSCT